MAEEGIIVPVVVIGGAVLVPVVVVPVVPVVVVPVDPPVVVVVPPVVVVVVVVVVGTLITVTVLPLVFVVLVLLTAGFVFTSITIGDKLVELLIVVLPGITITDVLLVEFVEVAFYL